MQVIHDIRIDLIIIKYEDGYLSFCIPSMIFFTYTNSPLLELLYIVSLCIIVRSIHK